MEAEDDQALLGVVRDHLIQEHPAIVPTNEQVSEMVATSSYQLEYAPAHAGSTTFFEEEFGPEPYWAWRQSAQQEVESFMRAEEACVGTKVRVRQEHRILGRRGMVGKVVGRYGGEEWVAVDVRFSDGQRWLFWPGDLEAEDLEEVSSSGSWWRSLIGDG
jgi:hypothetical protein